jgi:hypothetical protein
MSNDLETRLTEAFTAQAATTTTSDDAWARIHRRASARDHRRWVVLRSVAAAVVGLLVVGGGVALFRDRGDSGTVATDSASKSAADDAASAAGGGASEVAPVAPVAPFVPAGNGLEVQQNADGTIVVRLGSTTTAPVQPGGISAAIDGDTVFGVVPAETVDVGFGIAPDSPGDGVRAIGLGGGPAIDVPGIAGARVFAAERQVVGWAPGTADAVSVVALGGVSGGSRGEVGRTIARRNG